MATSPQLSINKLHPVIFDMAETVTIVLSNYNHGRYLAESLKSICEQTRPADKILVIDDGSTDNSVLEISKFEAQYPNLRMIRNSTNIGLQASIEKVMPLVITDCMVWSASDDVLLPDFLEKSMAALERHPNAGMCFSELTVLKGDTGVVQRFATEPSVAHIYDLRDLTEFMDQAAVCARMRRSYFPPTSNSVVVRMCALKSVGYFRPELEWHSDWLAYNAVAIKFGSCVIAKTLAHIREREDSYSAEGRRDPNQQCRVLDAMLDVIDEPGFEDVKLALEKNPSYYSVWGVEILPIMRRRPAFWRTYLNFRYWLLREKNRANVLSGKRWLLSKLPLIRNGMAKVKVSEISKERKINTETASADKRLDDGSYTLIIPTYRRPKRLQRLLAYLENCGLEAPVVVLDSSPDEEAELNAKTILASKLTVDHQRYRSDIHPYLKIRDGLKKIKTPFFSNIADDDLVVVPTLRNLVAFMKENVDYSAAHGMYVNFREYEEYFQISYIEQRNSEVLDETPIERLNEALSRYNFLFYAVQRAEVGRRAFDQVGKFKTTLCGELTTSLVVAIRGKVKRIDEFYIGRSTEESMSYSGWHPHQILANHPKDLFDDYAVFRKVMAAAVREMEVETRDDIEDIIDLIALRYISPFLKQEHLEFLYNEKVYGKSDGNRTYLAFWHKFVHPQRLEIDKIHLFMDEGRTFGPGMQRDTDPPRDYIEQRSTTAGVRPYVFHNEFFFPDLMKKICALSRQQTEFILEQFDRY
jgi:glycosyltransferase domain-containing protein